MTTKRMLVELLAQRSAKSGTFTLASGRQSHFYIDARLTTMSPDGLAVIGILGLDALRTSGWNIDAIGGLTLGADPIAYAISYASSASSHPLRAFTVRKQLKEHGTGKLVEGPLRGGDHVAIIEDVITTGRSALQAADAVAAAGASISGILALVDREEGGRSTLEEAGFPVITLVTATEILAEMKKQ